MILHTNYYTRTYVDCFIYGHAHLDAKILALEGLYTVKARE